MIAFSHIYKTAGMTFERILASTYGLNHLNVLSSRIIDAGVGFSAHLLTRVKKLFPNLQSISGHNIQPFGDLDQEFNIQYVAFCREPVKRMASNYQDEILVLKRRIPFEKWILEEWHHNRQTKMIAGDDDLGKAIRVIKEKDVFIGLTEKFDESLLLTKSLIDERLDIGYERVNVAKRHDIAERLLSDPRSRQMMMEVNQNDLGLYEHINQELHPRYRSMYGPTLQDDLESFQARRGGFNKRNVRLSRMKCTLIYKPLLYLYKVRYLN